MAAPPQQMQIPKDLVETLILILRDHPDLKQREGLLKLEKPDPSNGDTHKNLEFFRLKRLIRAIQSKQFSDAIKEKPEVMRNLKNQTRADCIQVIVLLLQLKFLTPVIKPAHQVLKKEFKVKPSKKFPTILAITAEIIKTVEESEDLDIADYKIDFAKPELSDDRYFCWNITPLDKTRLSKQVSPAEASLEQEKTTSTIWDKLKIVLIVSIGITLVLYPVWPYKMRVGVYYLSYGVLGLLAAFFVMAILRYALYLLTLPVCKSQGGFWIFPNLFEDCGFFDSFKPLYGFGEVQTYSYIKKMKKQKSKEKKALKQQPKN
ncbi:Sec63 complex subunit [Hanseniaspora uvarum]|nr:Sec63 complex subunit [Hanseniaspora uvarum]